MRIPAESVRGLAPALRPRADETVAPGEYFHSERALFRVERCDSGRALVENCRSGELIDVAVEHLLRLHRLER
jgi:hypothetical protein